MLTRTRVWIGLGLTAAIGLAITGAYQWALHAYGVSELTVGQGLLTQAIGVSNAPQGPLHRSVSVDAQVTVQVDEAVVPFRDVGETLGPYAEGDHLLIFRGAAVFDANGDGWPDIYFPQTGRPVAKATDGGVLQSKPLPARPGSLFLNLGPSADGTPQFEPLQERIRANDTYVREELLIEDKYLPRTSATQDTTGPGRIGTGAVSADFDGDGLLDLYVINNQHGVPMQTEQLGMPVYPARHNLGRDARREPFINRMPSFLWSDVMDGSTLTLLLGDHPEAEGRNSLYRNLGDRDGDGLPEWEDITDRAGVGGRWASQAASVVDFDRDGDLDLYVANFVDPDLWGFGDTHFGGQPNQLYVNQLAQTGELRFEDQAEALKISGRHPEEGLASGPYVPADGAVRYASKHLIDGEHMGYEADHSHASAFPDLNGDHWPDLVVANDTSNRLRVYLNRGGSFERQTRFDDSVWDGSWMGMNTGDLDGDGTDEVFVSNFGGQVMSARNNAHILEDDSELNIAALSVLNVPAGHAQVSHAFLTFKAGAFVNLTDSATLVQHPTMPPDLSRRRNMVRRYSDWYDEGRFATGLASLEFSWNGAFFDVENDGDLDLYFAGALKRGNDNFVGDFGGGPGRMLVNDSTPGALVFADQTLDYRLLDVREVNYDAPVPERPAPGTRWHKRDTIRLTDLDAYAGSGIEASDGSAISDLFRMHEAANGVYAADLNLDGWSDLLVTHAGGYDSVMPSARNLKVRFAGRTLAVPAPNKLMQPPTPFEPGHTSLYVHGGPKAGTDPHWVRLRLLDDTGHNRFAVGARATLNGHIARSVGPTGPSFGGVFEDLLVGLGEEQLTTLSIVWPHGPTTPESIVLEEPVARQLVCIRRGQGRVDCPKG